jgi:Uma2 family endonuclease
VFLSIKTRGLNKRRRLWYNRIHGSLGSFTRIAPASTLEAWQFMATATNLLTAEQFAALPDSDFRSVELVKGSLVEMNPPMPRHGEICANIARLLFLYLDEHPEGRIVTNDSNVLIERNPDTVRGPDVAYYSYRRVAKGPLPAGFLPVAPELVFEVLSPHDRWSMLHAKIADYLTAGVQAVCILDDHTRTLHAYDAERPPCVFSATDEFALPHILSEFRVQVEQFFA